jgi:hypothetical protein
MYMNAKMVPTKTILGMEEGIKERGEDKGEWGRG